MEYASGSYFGEKLNTDRGKAIRLSDFINSSDGRSLLLDTSIASCLGATPGQEDLGHVLNTFNFYLDGIILNPGAMERHAELLGGRDRAIPLVRVDWTNVFRNSDFCLPYSAFKRVQISDAEDALQIGASAVVAGFFMGFGDEAEAINIQTLSHLARECYHYSLPLVLDIQPLGEKVDKNNFKEAVTLGVSFMQELGADVLIVPDKSLEPKDAIGDWVKVPVLVRVDTIPGAKKIAEIFTHNYSGIVLSERVLTLNNATAKIRTLHSQVHTMRNKNVAIPG